MRDDDDWKEEKNRLRWQALMLGAFGALGSNVLWAVLQVYRVV